MKKWSIFHKILFYLVKSLNLKLKLSFYRILVMDLDLLRAVAGSFVTGVIVLTTKSKDSKIHGMTANSFGSVSFTPPLVLFTVNKKASIFEFLDLGVRFGISILAEHQKLISEHFAGQETINIDQIFEFIHGTPLIKAALGCYVTKIVRLIPAGTHHIVICEILHLFRNKDQRPLVYFAGQYQELPSSQKD